MVVTGRGGDDTVHPARPSPLRCPTRDDPFGPTNAAPSLPTASAACAFTVPQLLGHVQLLTHSLPQPNSPHPVLLCNHCLLPVNRHTQQPSSAQSVGHGEGDGEGSGGRESGGKLLNDPIHGYIYLEAELVALLDTPQFQRLRDLKQLGTCYLVFPGASHNRFEHSLGVAHLADVLLSHLSALQPELRITAKEKFLVKLAGLCHDLGHGPFSHVFDSEFIPRAMQLKAQHSTSASPSSSPVHRWHHEEASIMMLKEALTSAGLELSASDLSFVCEVIDPANHPPRTSLKPFLYEVVANARTSLDVDKLDYLARDCHNIGMSTNLRHDRLIRHCRVIDGRLCFNSKEVYNLYELFHTRYSLFKQVYSHRVSKAIEYMITDVLLLADAHLRISDAIRSPQRYLALTDCVLKQIEVSTDDELREARALILRIRQRKLYRLVEEAIIPIALSAMPDIEAEELLASQTLVAPSEVVVENLRIHYALREKNPVDFIRFFDKANLNASYAIPKQKVSHVMPQHFHERLLRVYLKDVEDEVPLKPKFHAVKAATIAWLKAHDCVSPVITRTASGALLRSRAHSFLRPIEERDGDGDGEREERSNGGFRKEHSSGQRSNAVQGPPPHLDASPSSLASPSPPPSQSLASATLRRLTALTEEEQGRGRAENGGMEEGDDGHRLQGGARKRRREDSLGGSSVSSLSSAGSQEVGPPFRSSHAPFASPPSSSPSSSPTPPFSASQSPSPSPDGGGAVGPSPPPAPSGRRTSMDPPSPLLSHPHAHYHLNPTLACHMPNLTHSQSILSASTPPPSPPHRTLSPSPHRHGEWKRQKGVDGLMTGGNGPIASFHSSASPHLSPHSPRSPALPNKVAAQSFPQPLTAAPPTQPLLPQPQPQPLPRRQHAPQ